MTVSELIEWLKTQDQGAIVQVIRGERSRGYDGGDICHTEDFTAGLSYNCDLRGSSHIKPDASYYNQRSLLLGEKP